jgi:hypothetical protein
MSENSANDDVPITNAFDVDREADLASRLPEVCPGRKLSSVPEMVLNIG